MIEHWCPNTSRATQNAESVLRIAYKKIVFGKPLEKNNCVRSLNEKKNQFFLNHTIIHFENNPPSYIF